MLFDTTHPFKMPEEFDEENTRNDFKRAKRHDVFISRIGGRSGFDSLTIKKKHWLFKRNLFQRFCEVLLRLDPTESYFVY